MASSLESLKTLTRYAPESLVANVPEFVAFYQDFIDYVIQYNSLNVASVNDIDQLSDQYIQNIRNFIAPDIPLSNQLRNLTKAQIIELFRSSINLYKSKGTINSIKYLFRVLFGSETIVELGRLGSYLEYQPLELEVKAIDNSGNPITIDYNSLSFQPFFLEVNGVPDTLQNGTSVTYFGLRGKNYIWINSDIQFNPGDRLYFPANNTIVEVLSISDLEVNGWYGKKERWKDENGFFIIEDVNPRIDVVYFNEVNGYDKVQAVNSTIVVNSITFDFQFGQLHLSYPQVPYGQTISGTTNLEVISNGVTYTASTTVIVDTNGIVQIMCGGSDLTSKYYNGAVSIPVYLFTNGGVSPVTQTELANVRDLISRFSIYFINTVSPDVYMKTIRDIVVPAGYSLAHVNLISGEAFADVSGQGTEQWYDINYSRPYAICSLSPADFDAVKIKPWGDGFYIVNDFNHVSLQYFLEDNLYYSTLLQAVVGFNPLLNYVNTDSQTYPAFYPTYDQFMATVGSPATFEIGALLDQTVNFNSMPITTVNSNDIRFVVYRETDVTLTTH